jgi:hypothetical protein
MSQQYRWGGLAGVAGGLLFIFVFVFVGVVVGADTSVATFPDIRPGRTVENALYLAVLLLLVAPFLVLGRALRETRPGAATYGSVVGIVGLGILAAGALPHAAGVGISDLYRAPGADQAALTAAWQVNQAVMNMLLVTGLAIVPVGVIGLGVAMLGTPGFGRGIGRVSLALGGIGVVAAVVLLVDPLSPVAAIGFFALIAFNLAVGWKLYSLSRAAVMRPATGPAVTGRSVG